MNARGVQVELRDPLRTHAIPERLRGVFMTRRYTDPCLPLPYLTLPLEGKTLQASQCLYSWQMDVKMIGQPRIFPAARRGPIDTKS